MNPLVLSLVLALAFPVFASAQQIKIGAVDMSKIFAEYYKTKKAEGELKERAAGYEKELKERAAELQKLQEDGRKLEEDAENPAFNDEKRSEKRKLRDAKLTEFRLLAQTLNEMKNNRERELREQQGRVRGAIVDEIIKVVQDIAKRDGYNLVVDKTGNTLSGVSAFLYVQDTLDITASVVKELNKSAPPGGAAAPAADKKK
ncbi:MAG: OmpH family outer membrane protein [Verrucomicrobiae bacterium]|nr:OmpH family outer membrane protein [Verrucomicrobiae bacterium]